VTEEEHDERLALASGMRSADELATLTADLPPGIAARLPVGRDVWIGVGLILAAVGVLATIVAFQPDNALAFVAALGAAVTILFAPGITVALMIDVRHQRRSARRR
jgi:hypothetical protein